MADLLRWHQSNKSTNEVGSSEGSLLGEVSRGEPQGALNSSPRRYSESQGTAGMVRWAGSVTYPLGASASSSVRWVRWDLNLTFPVLRLSGIVTVSMSAYGERLGRWKRWSLSQSRMVMGRLTGADREAEGRGLCSPRMHSLSGCPAVASVINHSSLWSYDFKYSHCSFSKSPLFKSLCWEVRISIF
jgi:hypothetical protein